MHNGPRVLDVIVAALLVAGVVAAVVQGGNDDGPSTSVEAGGSGSDAGTDADADADVSTTLAAPATLAPTTTTAVVPTSTMSAPRASTATTAPTTTAAVRPTTTAAPRARAFDMTPTSGPPNTRVVASGGGCQGDSYGVSLHIYDPSGQAVDGDGGAAQPDGTWSLEFHIGNYQAGPGDYSVRPMCVNGAGSVVFEYTPRTFTVT